MEPPSNFSRIIVLARFYKWLGLLLLLIAGGAFIGKFAFNHDFITNKALATKKRVEIVLLNNKEVSVVHLPSKADSAKAAAATDQTLFFTENSLLAYNNRQQQEPPAPKIAFVIDTLPVEDFSLMNKAIALPEFVTLVLGTSSSYPNILQDNIDQTNLLKHDILVHLPLENGDASSAFAIEPAGQSHSQFLSIEASHEQNLHSLERILSFFQGYIGQEYIGVSSDRFETFTDSVSAIYPVFEYLKARNKVFLYNREQKNILLEDLAAQIPYPLVKNDFYLERTLSSDQFTALLDTLAHESGEKGYTIAVIEPSFDHLTLLHSWLENPRNYTLDFVALSEITSIYQKEDDTIATY